MGAACGGASGGKSNASASPPKGGDSGKAPAPSQNATLTVAVGTNPNSFDPDSEEGPELNPTWNNIYQPLFNMTKSGQLVPFIGTSFTTSSDGLTATLRLRPGVTFSDGTPLDASAVKFNIQRAEDPKSKSVNAPFFKVIKSMTAVDPQTLQMNLSTPSSILQYVLTWPFIVSPKSLTENGNSYLSILHPVGSGPYVLQSYTPNDQATLVRRTDYWGTEPYYSKIVFRFVPEANTRESLLLAGQVDVIAAPDYADVAGLKQNSAVKLAINPSDRDIVVSLDTQDPRLSNPKVRQALNYAVNKTAAIKAVLRGYGTAMDSPTSQQDVGTCKVGSYAYDPNKAKQLLSQAGESNLSLNMISPTGRYPEDYQAAQVVASDLQAVGVHVNLQTFAWPTLLAKILVPASQQTYPLQFLGYASQGADALTLLREFTQSLWAPHGVGLSFYTSPQTEQLFTQAETATTNQQVQNYTCQMDQAIWQAAPWIFLWNYDYIMAYKSNLTGMSFLTQDPESFVLTGMHPA